MFPYPLGLEADRSVDLGPIVTSNGMALLTYKPQKYDDYANIEAWISVFDLYTRAYIALVCFIFTVTFIVTVMVPKIFFRRRRGRYMKKKKNIVVNKIEIIGPVLVMVPEVLNQLIHRRAKDNGRGTVLKEYKYLREGVGMFKNIFWNIYQLLLNIYSFETPTPASSVLGTSFALFIFFLIQGVFLSLASTDMVTPHPAKFIDSIERLLNDPNFNDTNVIMPGSMWQEMALKNSRAGTVERGVYERINEWMSIKFDVSFVTYLTEYIFKQKIETMKSVVSTELRFLPIVKSVGCQMMGRVMQPMYICKDTFSVKNLVSIVSKSSDRRLFDWVKYYQTRVFQCGWLNEELRRAPDRINLQMNMTHIEAIGCVKAEDDPIEMPPAMAMTFIANLFYLHFICILFAAVLVIEEIVEHRIVRILSEEET